MTAQQKTTAIVGSGRFVYEANNAWEQLPDDWSFVEAVGAVTDSSRRVYVFNRGVHPLIVFDAEGRFLESWGEGEFVRPHGIWIDADDILYLTDDQDHTIRKYTTSGQLLMTMGTSGQGSDSGVVGSDYRTIKRGAPPFNQPTNLAIAPGGDLYVTDGYGNARVHRFSPEGKLISSWGGPGVEPGQFNLPHGIDIDSTGRVFVADRENSRLQIFSPEGEFLEEWTQVSRPDEIFIDKKNNDTVYVAELGWRVGTSEPNLERVGGSVGIFDIRGELLCRFGTGDNPGAPGDFIAPHDIWVDSGGDVYVSEVTVSAAVSKGLVSADCPSFQKFTLQA